MIEFIALPNCSDSTAINAGMAGSWLAALVLMASLSKLNNKSERIRIYGETGLFLGLFFGMFAMFKTLNDLFFCNVIEPVDTSRFWLMNILANLILVMTVCGFILGLWKLRRFSKYQGKGQ